MKKVFLVMVSLYLFPRLLVAHELNIQSLVGEDWYGLYMNGEKAGYLVSTVTAEDGVVALAEDARFQVKMVGVQQDMRIYVKRVYHPGGELMSIEQQVIDIAGTKTWKGAVEGGVMRVTSSVGGDTRQAEYPKPRESLKDALKQVQLVGTNAKVGDALSFSVFEPLYEKEIDGTSRIEAIEERVLEGAPTRVFKVRSELPLLGVSSVSYVAEDGTTLEDQVAGMVTMRLEPKEVAQDVTYSNDVIVANAALVDKPIARPRSRQQLRLRVVGPLVESNLFNNERQTLKPDGDAFAFVGTKVSLDGFAAARLPISDEAVQPWLKPTLLVQSDHPRLIAQAREIVGDERDAFAASSKLCHWVHEHVRTAFSAQLTNALEVLDRPEGDCTEHSILFIGLARAAGIPAREAAGLIYVESGQPGFYFHQWASVWVGKWVEVDPTFNQPLADVTHIKLAEGDLFEQARLIPMIGKLRVEVAGEEPEEAP